MKKYSHCSQDKVGKVENTFSGVMVATCIFRAVFFVCVDFRQNGVTDTDTGKQ